MVDRGKTFQVVANIIMALLVLFCLVPFVLLIISSITKETSLVKYGYSFIPREIDLAAYKYLLVDSTDIIRGYGISALVTVVGTICNLTITTLFAYPLSRRDLPARNVLAFFLFFTMLFNGGLVPSYINILNLGLRDTYWAIVLPGAISAYEVFVFRTFFSEIPSSLEESAYIDGAGHFRTLFSIILPLSKALLATFALFAIVRYWNDYMSALLYLDSSSKHPIQLFLRKILNTMRMDDIKDYAMLQELNKINSRTVQNAAIVITIVPILCVYPFVQKYFMIGMLMGSVKG